MRWATRCAAGASLFLFAIMPRVSAASDLEEMVTVIHLHSSRSGGRGDPIAIGRAARAAGVDAVLFGDHYLARVSYAPWPIGNVLGFALSRPAVMGMGVDRYLEEINAVEREVPGLLLLPGLEVAPFARWSGSLLRGTLELRGWHRHLLLLGIEDAVTLERLPVSGNRRGGVYGRWSFAYLIPAAILFGSVFRLTRAPHDRRSGRIGPIAAAGMSLSILILGFPFRVDPFSPVGPDPGAAPFQEFVDHVRPLGGLVILAHPEAGQDRMEAFGVRLLTQPYPALAQQATFDGFAALPRGTRTLLPPGGLWDLTLADYLSGTRPNPLWAIAENDDHGAALEIDFGRLQTIVWTRERTHAGILEALRSGRHYARSTPRSRSPLRLANWRIDSLRGSAMSGGTLRADGPIWIRAAIKGGDGAAVTIRVIRSGHVIHSRRVIPPFEIELRDEAPADTFYRLDVIGAYPRRLITNPIFVRAAEARS